MKTKTLIFVFCILVILMVIILAALGLLWVFAYDVSHEHKGIPTVFAFITIPAIVGIIIKNITNRITTMLNEQDNNSMD